MSIGPPDYAQVLRMTASFETMLQNQRGHLFPWSAVFYGMGIGSFFALRSEPEVLIWWVVGLGLLCCLLVVLGGSALRPLLIAVICLSFGFAIAAWRSNQVAEPVLGFRYYGPIEGRVIGVDRSASDAVRLTLDQVRLFNMRPGSVPARVRVSLYGDQSRFQVEPGAVVMTTGSLSPPSGPVEPGGFDFQRHAWFLRLGGVGYTRNPVMTLAPPDKGLAVFRFRMRLSEGIRARLPGQSGAVAAAVMTGDRSAMDQDVLEDLRASNLAHLLAISGLHMGFLAAVVFAFIRGGLALWPRVAMHLEAKKISAAGALLAAAGYLALSGGAIATERAFVMVSVALVAVLLGRQAISLRAVAVAALIVLTLTPEALLSPGFQMSFSATTALVAVFAAIRDGKLALGGRWLRPVVVLVISSSVAGLATAPFGAAQFNQIAQWGLLANVLSVPVMGMLVIPGAVIAAVLAPFGLEWIGLKIAAMGLEWILFVAHWVAGMDGAVRPVVQPERGVLVWLSLGALFVILWQGRLRWAGLAAFFVAIWIWAGTERPAILIADSGGLVGVMTEGGRSLSRARSSRFIAGVWLENDGTLLTQAEAYALWENRVRHVTGRKAVAGLTCTEDQLVVTNYDAPDGLPCTVISPRMLRQTGSIAIDISGNRTTVRDVQGARMWHPWGRDQ